MEKLDILETCLYIDDLDAAEAFYQDILGLEKIAKAPGRHIFFRLGSSVLLIFKPDASLVSQDLPPHGAHGPAHRCFKIPGADIEAWKERLEAQGVEIIAEQRWPQGEISFYFHDPAGNVLELAPARIWGLS